MVRSEIISKLSDKIHRKIKKSELEKILNIKYSNYINYTSKVPYKTNRQLGASIWDAGSSGAAEEILNNFYHKYVVEMNKKGWVSDFKGAQYKGIKISADLINADTGEVAAESGTKMTPRYINKLKELGLKKTSKRWW